LAKTLRFNYWMKEPGKLFELNPRCGYVGSMELGQACQFE
jgi:hypothetical protein